MLDSPRRDGAGASSGAGGKAMLNPPAATAPRLPARQPLPRAAFAG
jgi:hypothetical protein